MGSAALRSPDSIAPSVIATASFPTAGARPRRFGWVVGVAVALSAGILVAATVRVVMRGEATASASQAVPVMPATADVSPQPAPPPPQAAPAPTEVPVISIEKLPHAKGSKSGKPAKAKRH
jgi:hypothetical protein